MTSFGDGRVQPPPHKEKQAMTLTKRQSLLHNLKLRWNSIALVNLVSAGESKQAEIQIRPNNLRVMSRHLQQVDGPKTDRRRASIEDMARIAGKVGDIKK